MLPFPLFLALKYLKPKRSLISVVSVISVLGVLLGVAILVIVLSVMSGFDNMWRDKILSFKPHLTVYSRYGAIEREDDLCQTIEAVEGVTGAAPAIETRVLLQFRGHMLAPIVVGLSPERAARISRVPGHMRRGVFDLEDRQTVIGVDLAAQIGLSVGDKTLAYSARGALSGDEMYLPEELVVAGIFDMGMRDFDAGFILTSLDVARDLVGLETGVHSIYVMTRDPFMSEAQAERVRAAIPAEFVVKTWKDVDVVLFDALRHEKTMMFVLLVFITIVAIFCVTNTLIVITIQKTSEIGLLKALGFTPLEIMAAFVWLGWIQCLVGIGAGIGCGLLVLRNLKGMVDWLSSMNVRVFPKEIYGLDEIPWSLSVGEVVFVAFFVMVFCTLSSLLPAWQAARLNPADALRHE